MEIEKGPGYDWEITYKTGDEPIETMSVFGCLTPEKALEEARYSLGTELDFETTKPVAFTDYTILAVKRIDLETLV